MPGPVRPPGTIDVSSTPPTAKAWAGNVVVDAWGEAGGMAIPGGATRPAVVAAAVTVAVGETWRPSAAVDVLEP